MSDIDGYTVFNQATEDEENWKQEIESQDYEEEEE